MMKIKHVLVPFIGLCFGIAGNYANAQDYSWDHLPAIAAPVFKKDTFNIARYGAIPDGITLNTEPINKAIAECSRSGGGVVLVPAGLWLTGPIVLRSGVNLHIERAAILQFTDDRSQYPMVKGNWEGRPAVRCQSPISGEGLDNIAITGTGIIDGNGDVWRPASKDSFTAAEWNRMLAVPGSVLSDDGKALVSFGVWACRVEDQGSRSMAGG